MLRILFDTVFFGSKVTDRCQMEIIIQHHFTGTILSLSIADSKILPFMLEGIFFSKFFQALKFVIALTMLKRSSQEIKKALPSVNCLYW